jgi:TolA-binding protein
MTKKKSNTVKKTKTTRKAKPSKRRSAAESDRCQPLRDQLKELDQEIADLRESLTDPDIPNDIKARHRKKLQQLITTQTHTLKAFEACEAIEDDPRS